MGATMPTSGITWLMFLSSLDLDKVPDKLKCAQCHEFNLTAHKTTCCDTCICESC